MKNKIKLDYFLRAFLFVVISCGYFALKAASAPGISHAEFEPIGGKESEESERSTKTQLSSSSQAGVGESLQEQISQEKEGSQVISEQQSPSSISSELPVSLERPEESGVVSEQASIEIEHGQEGIPHATTEPSVEELQLRAAIKQTQDTVHEFSKAWQEVWAKRDPKDLPSELFSDLVEKFRLGELSSNLLFKSFDVSKVENGIEKRTTLVAQYDALKSFDEALADVAEQLTGTYGQFRRNLDINAVADAATTIAVITNMRGTIIDEQQKIYDGITDLDTWQHSSFKSLLQGVVITKESFATEQLPKTLKLLTTLTDNLTKMEKEIAGSQDEIMLNVDFQAFDSWLNELEQLEREIPESAELKEAREKLSDLLDISNQTWSSLNSQRILVTTRSFTSRINDMGAYLRKLISTFFSIVVGNSPLSRVIQLKGVNVGDKSAEAQAVEELFKSGASQDRRKLIYSDLRQRINQVNNSIRFASEFTDFLSKIPPDELTADQRRVLTELRSTLINHLDSIKKFGDMLGVQIKSPSDGFGTTMINVIKQLYEPAQKNIWLLPLITGDSVTAAKTIQLLESQAVNASQLLNKLNNQIFKQTSAGTQALYTVSLISEVTAQIAGTLGIGSLVAVGAFVKFAGAGLPFMNLAYMVPIFLVSGGALAYMVSYATYQAALKLGGLSS